jgi:hypothetical protein
MSDPIHRDGDARVCEATTIVVGQGSVYANNRLVSVNGDINTHGNGQLIAQCREVYAEGILVVNHTPDNAQPDDLCLLLGEPHCNPKTAIGSPNVFVGE